MESPESCLTNVLRIDGLSHIPYRVYVPTSRRPNPLQDSSPTSTMASRSSTLALRQGEVHMRENGILGVSDIRNGELWVFDVDIGNSLRSDNDTVMTGVEAGVRQEGATPISRRILEFPPGCGLREAREGVFPPSSIVNNAKAFKEEAPLGSSTNAIDLTGPDKPSPENSTPSSSLLQDPPHLIYKHLMASILAAVSYSICRNPAGDRRYIPLNMSTLVQMNRRYTPLSTIRTTNTFSLPTPPSTARIQSESGADGYGKYGLMMFSLTGYLTSTGTLCIIPTGRKPIGLDSLCCLLPPVGEDSNASAVICREVWIAPWGRVGRVKGLISHEPNPLTGWSKDEWAWAEDVIAYLWERGIEIGEAENQWVRVETWLADEDEEERLETIVWPTILCFIRLTEGDKYHLPSPMDNTIPVGSTTTPINLSGKGKSKATKRDASRDQPILVRKIYEDNEYLALGGLTSSFRGDLKNLDDPGVIWFSGGALDPIEFAEKWKMAGVERKMVIQSQREEKEREKRKIAEAEILKRKTEELMLKEKELRKVDEVKKEATVIGSVGVYPTPPDAQPITNALVITEIPESLQPEPSSAVSLDSATLPLSLGNEMDLDWGAAGDPMSLDTAGSALGKTNATDGLAGLTAFLGDDLVDGDDDIFATEVTDKDFDFFDEPEFEAALDSGIGLTQLNQHGQGTVTSTVGGLNVPALAVSGVMDMNNDPSHTNTQNLDSTLANVADGSTTVDYITIPIIAKVEIPVPTSTARVDNPIRVIEQSSAVVIGKQTPPLSPQRAMKLLLPQYTELHADAEEKTKENTTPVNLTPRSDDIKESAHKRFSIYSPLKFLPGVEMADKKYMEGGRFFRPPPLEEKPDSLDGKLALITLDSPSQRKQNNRKPLSNLGTNTLHDPIHLSQPSEPLTEDIDIRPRDDDEHESNESGNDEDNDSSESDIDEEHETHYGLPQLPDSSPMFAPGGKRKRALQDDGDLAMTESGRGEGHTPTPQPTVQGGHIAGDYDEYEIAPPPWQSMVPDPEDYCLVEVFEMISAGHTAKAGTTPGGNRLSDTEYVSVSKILVDQVVIGTILSNRKPGIIDKSTFEEDDEEESLIRRQRMVGESRVEEAVREVFGAATRCTLENYASIPDANIEPLPLQGRANLRPIAPSRRAQSKQPAVPPGTPTLGFDVPSFSSTTFKIPPSHVHVHRGETALEISPVSLKFWDTFGFGPCSGPKNVIAFCIYPAGEAMMDSVDEFMERLGVAYDSCKLGNYVRGSLDEIKGGMVGVQLPLRHAGELDLGPIMQSIKDSCLRLGSMLSCVADELQNIVVYMVNPFSKASALVDLCYAFHHLQQAYMIAMAELKTACPNNIVLQIVPVDFIIATNGLVTPPQSEYTRFCLEVYNRCIPTETVPSTDQVQDSKVSPFPPSSSSSKISMTKGSSSLREKNRKFIQQAVYSPSIVLAKPPPRAINFQLSPEPIATLMHEGSCLHVAYKQSLDERWVVFAWTDNWGEFQSTETYCLGRKGCNALKPWEEVTRDAWRSIMDCIRRKKMAPKICITKVGGWVDPDEVELWNTLSIEPTLPHTLTHPGPSHNTSSPSLSLTILVTDPSPQLSLVPTLPAIIPQAFNPQSSLFTPVSTPQPSTLSPDPSGATAAMNQGTPGADAIPDLDPDAQLVDYVDEVWGVVLAHKLPIGSTTVDARHALASGFLVRRGAAGLEGGEEPIVMGVNLASMTAGGGVIGATPTLAGLPGGQAPRKHTVEGALREVLTQYRGLVTLAQHKGVVETAGKKGSVLPWHVAAVERAVTGLEICM